MIRSHSNSAGRSHSTGVRRLSCLAASLALPLMLGACGPKTPLVQIKTERIVPPAGLLVCDDAPEAPPKPRTQQQVAVYIAELRAAHADCRAAIEDIRRWSER